MIAPLARWSARSRRLAAAGTWACRQAAAGVLLVAVSGCAGQAGAVGHHPAAAAGRGTPTMRTRVPGVLTAAICATPGLGAPATPGERRLYPFDADLLDALGFKLALRVRLTRVDCARVLQALAERAVDVVATAPARRPEVGVRRVVYLALGGGPGTDGVDADLALAPDNPGLAARLAQALEELVFEGVYADIFRRHLAPLPVPLAFQPPD